MSDLHRAVEDEIDAFRPDRTPPFGALLERHRARSRRRYAAGAVALSAVAVAGIVFVPSAMSGGSDRLPSYADPGSTGAPRVAVCQDATTSCEQYMPDQEGDALLAALREAPSAEGTANPCAAADIVHTYTVWADSENGSVLLAQAPEPARCTVIEVEDQPRVYSIDLRAAVLAGVSQDEPTRYAITSQDAFALNRHERAIQDCLGLPGVSRVASDGFVAPDGTVAVAGADENAAFLDCMNQLEGVVLQERPAPSSTPAPSAEPALWEPPSFAQRQPLPSCGSFERRAFPLPPEKSAACLARAVGSAEGAELKMTAFTVEGDPIIRYYRALPGEDTVEVFYDSTRDKLGSQSWSRSLCTGFDAATGEATGCAEADL